MLNTVALMGRLVADPKTFSGDENKKSLATFTLAVNLGDEAHFFDCKVFGQENTVNYLQQGDKIAISGRLAQEKFTRKDGSNGSSVVIIVNNIEFADVVGTDEEPEPEPVEEKPVAKTRRTR